MKYDQIIVNYIEWCYIEKDNSLFVISNAGQVGKKEWCCYEKSRNVKYGK